MSSVYDAMMMLRVDFDFNSAWIRFCCIHDEERKEGEGNTPQDETRILRRFDLVDPLACRYP